MKSLTCLENFGGLVGFKNRNSNSLLQLKLNGSGSGASVPSSPFLGSSLKRVSSRFNNKKLSSKNLKVVAEYDETKQTSKDRWGGLAYDTSDDQQDITRGKGMVDSLFQAPMGTGTHYAVLSSYEYISAGLRQYNFDNTVDGYYISPAFMDKLVVPLIFGIWGGKGQGKSFQCELVFAKMGIKCRKARWNHPMHSQQSDDFFGALRARVYDDEVRKWISGIGVENIGRRLVNSKEGPPKFEQPKMTLNKLLEYGSMLVQEQENVKQVQLSDKYLKEAALGDANDNAIKRGTFYGKAAQQVKVPVPEGCIDPSAENFDPTARSDDGSCIFQIEHVDFSLFANGTSSLDSNPNFQKINLSRGGDCKRKQRESAIGFIGKGDCLNPKRNDRRAKAYTAKSKLSKVGHLIRGLSNFQKVTTCDLQAQSAFVFMCHRLDTDKSWQIAVLLPWTALHLLPKEVVTKGSYKDAGWLGAEEVGAIRSL
ncbi:hypothetical protein RJ641_028381 [Dillenia turbinata]|uniref:Ribulose bisphosphate carboxylase/oxygenase activase AAA helical domain-containing protein n=1 Tax=Dillenia turbinata TaxID=194707 RepID=A0AAN8ZIZ1_9MAGN